MPLLREAGALIKNGEFSAALDLYLEGANLSPDDWRPYQGAGNAFSKLDDLDHALQYYREALALKGNDEKLIRRINEIEVAVQSRSANPSPAIPPSRQWNNKPEPAKNDSRASSDPPPDWVARLEALENEASQKTAEKRGSFAAKFTPGRLLGSQFNKSGKSVANALANVDWSIDWFGLGSFLTPNLTYSYSVISNPNVFGGELDFRRQVSPNFSFGFRFGFQKIIDPLVIETKIEDPDPFFPFSVDFRAAQDEAKLISLGIQLHYTKVGKKIDFYLGAIPSLYFASISQSETLTFSAFGVSRPIANITSKVSGTGIGGAIQSGVKVKLGPAISFFADGGLEMMRVGSMKGNWTYSALLLGAITGSAVWVRDNSSYFGEDVQEYYLIVPTDAADNANNITETAFSLAMIKLGLGFGIAF